jgi:hypothetical protein
MRLRAGRLAAAAIGLLLALKLTGAKAADLPVDLVLALAIDVSGSIDPDEARLQREGYIEAFRNPRIVQAIKSGPFGRIAVAYYEWAGFGHHRVIVPWTLVDSEKSALALADALTRNPPQTARRTAIGDAIVFGTGFFENNGFQGRRKVIDISGDGANNWGTPVTEARAKALERGVTINGLPIMNDKPSGFVPAEPNLDLYYQSCVIGGPGAFIEVAHSFDDFGRAVLRKMVLEIADIRPDRSGRSDERAARLLRGIPAPRLATGMRGVLRVADDERIAPPCDYGERLWNGRWGN